MNLPIDRFRLAKTKQEWTAKLARFAALPCTPANRQQWSDIVTKAQAVIVDLEAERLNLTKPINEDLREINRSFSEAAGPAEALKELAKRKIKEGLEAEAKEKAEALKRLAEAATDEQVSAALAAIPTASTAGKGVRTSWKWVATVADFAALPDEYKLVNEKKLAAHCKKFSTDQEPSAITGVSFNKEAQVAANGSRK